MLRRLKIKFVCINMLTVTLLMCVIMALVISSTRSGFAEQSMRALEALAVSRPAPGRGYELPPGMPRMPAIILDTDSSGEIHAVGDSAYDLEDEEFVRAIYELADSAEPFGVLEDYSLRYSHSPRDSGRIVFVDTSGEQAMLAELYKNSALIGAASFFVFLAVSVLLANWAVKPVDRAWREQRQFVADASHELKTPLTVITTNAELLAARDGETGAAAGYSGNILSMAKRMRALIEGLLELARADSGQLEMNFERLDMSRLCLEALLPFEPLYFEKGLELESVLEEGVFVRGSGEHLRQLADILLDNARKYSTQPGLVEFRLKKQGGSCVITVENPSEEISPADRKNIFRRFYRLDKARSADGSYGLGLSIAESIVSAHKGKIRCDWNQGRACFTVTLPAAQ